jgi:hypothetical protein
MLQALFEQHNSFLRPLKKKGFKEERVTTIGLYDIGKSHDPGIQQEPFGIGDKVHHPGTAQGGLVEKAQGTHGLDEDALGGVGMEQMELIGADVLGAQASRRGAKVLGELGDVAQIAIDRVGRVIAYLHVFEHAST